MLKSKFVAPSLICSSVSTNCFSNIYLVLDLKLLHFHWELYWMNNFNIILAKLATQLSSCVLASLQQFATAIVFTFHIIDWFQKWAWLTSKKGLGSKLQSLEVQIRPALYSVASRQKRQVTPVWWTVLMKYLPFTSPTPHIVLIIGK